MAGVSFWLVVGYCQPHSGKQGIDLWHGEVLVIIICHYFDQGFKAVFIVVAVISSFLNMAYMSISVGQFQGLKVAVH